MNGGDPKKKKSTRDYMEYWEKNQDKHSPDWEMMGPSRKIENSPIEKTIPMYPTKKMTARKKAKLVGGNETVTRMLSGAYRPGPEATNIKRKVGAETIESGKQRYNAYLKSKGMRGGLVK